MPLHGYEDVTTLTAGLAYGSHLRKARLEGTRQSPNITDIRNSGSKQLADSFSSHGPEVVAEPQTRKAPQSEGEEKGIPEMTPQDRLSLATEEVSSG